MPDIDNALKDENKEVSVKLQEVYKAKLAHSLSDMCVGRAHALKKLAQEVTSLGFKSKPNYE